MQALFWVRSKVHTELNGYTLYNKIQEPHLQSYSVLCDSVSPIVDVEERDSYTPLNSNAEEKKTIKLKLLAPFKKSATFGENSTGK